MSQQQYDEVGSRTRQAWLRTALGLIVATLLAERSLMIAEASLIAMFLALIPALVGVSVSVARVRRLQVHESEGIPRTWALIYASALILVAGVAFVAVLT